MQPSTKEDIEKFWKSAESLHEYKISLNNIAEATYSEITTNEIKSATSEFSDFETSGGTNLQFILK